MYRLHALLLPLLLLPFSAHASEATLEQLFDRLSEGGHVIYWRHAATDHRQRDQNLNDMDRCEQQRNLSEQGREQARLVGRVFKERAIPIAAVYSSAFCRNRETATLALGRYTILPELWNLPAAHTRPLSREALVDGLRKLLGDMPEQGSNTLIVGHNLNLRAAANVAIGEGEIAVFQPDGDGRFRLVGSFKPEQLQF